MQDSQTHYTSVDIDLLNSSININRLFKVKYILYSVNVERNSKQTTRTQHDEHQTLSTENYIE